MKLLGLVGLILISCQGGAADSNWMQLKASAQDSSPLIQEAQKNVEAQMRTKQSIYGEFSPQINLKASQLKTDYDPTIPGETEDVKEYGIEGQINVFNGFASQGRLLKNQALQSARRAQARQVSIEVRYLIRQAYFRWLVAQKKVELAEKILVRQTQNAKFIGLKYKSGGEAKWSFDKARAEEQDAQLRLDEQKKELLKAELDLKRIVGGQLPPLAETNPSIYLQSLPTRDLQMAVDSHPDVQFLQAQSEASRKEVTIARSEYLPKVDAGYSYSQKTLDGVDNIDVTEVGITATLNIFSGLSTHRRVQAARASKMALEARTVQARRDVRTLIEQSRLDYSLLLRKLPIVREILQSAQARVKTVTNQYKVGLQKFLDWEQAHVKLVEAEQQEVEVLENVLLARAQWERAIGLDLRSNEGE